MLKQLFIFIMQFLMIAADNILQSDLCHFLFGCLLNSLVIIGDSKLR